MKYPAGMLLPLLFFISGCAAPAITAFSGAWTTYQINEEVKKQEAQARVREAAREAMKDANPGVSIKTVSIEYSEKAKRLGFRCHPAEEISCKEFISRVEKNPKLASGVRSTGKEIFLEKIFFHGNGYDDIDTRASDDAVLSFLAQ